MPLPPFPFRSGGSHGGARRSAATDWLFDQGRPLALTLIVGFSVGAPLGRHGSRIPSFATGISHPRRYLSTVRFPTLMSAVTGMPGVT